MRTGKTWLNCGCDEAVGSRPRLQTKPARSPAGSLADSVEFEFFNSKTTTADTRREEGGRDYRFPRLRGPWLCPDTATDPERRIDPAERSSAERKRSVEGKGKSRLTLALTSTGTIGENRQDGRKAQTANLPLRKSKAG
jgi:hypothetical protein